jgi:hypothetical protein
MGFVTREVIYFQRPGPKNTEVCLDLVRRAVAEGFGHVVVASTTGATGRLFAETLDPGAVNLVVVGHSVGFKEPNHDEFDPTAAEFIRERGGKVLKTTILTHSIETALITKHSGLLPGPLIAETLRRLGQGVKVVCEMVMEAVDAGVIPEAETVVAVAGTGRGADTVCLVKSAASKRFLDLFVSQILAKPMA